MLEFHRPAMVVDRDEKPVDVAVQVKESLMVESVPNTVQCVFAVAPRDTFEWADMFVTEQFAFVVFDGKFASCVGQRID